MRCLWTTLRGISIHAPRVGSDVADGTVKRIVLISIHAPRVGSDGGVQCHQHFRTHFNPRSPCGERHLAFIGGTKNPQFQSTLPVWGATTSYVVFIRVCRFQSTLPVWGATHILVGFALVLGISIHAPRVGSDRYSLLPVRGFQNFNPRSPCGERPFTLRCSRVSQSFQSTLPVWGATQLVDMDKIMSGFQSTLPVWGATTS